MSLPSYKYTKKLNGKRVLILGATSGIGFAVAEACFEYGANIIISGSHSERLEKTVQRLRENYGTVESRVHTHTCDLSDEANLESNVEKLLQAATENGTHKLNHIAFTAGDSIPIQKINDITIPIIRKQEIVRFLGPVMIAKHLEEYMEKSPDSSFTITGGVNSWKPRPGWSLPASSGSRAEGLARGLAVDLAPIRVNLVSPGAIKTELFKRAISPQVEKAFTQKTLIKRLGRPEDTAEAYLYMMKDGFVTGTVLDTNGGYLLVT
jgi:NAD(P)-dependent dehydrogenase (short-subunit alcohol dehydrogenase family)